MYQNPLISVIVPIYNVEKYIEKCLHSIKFQKYENIEVVMIDDGSTDSSGVLATEFAKTDSRFLYYKKENGGLSSARNYGLDVCSGAFVSFVDGDDWVEEDYLSSMLEAIALDDSDIAICNMRYLFEDGSCRKRVPRIMARACVDRDEAFNDLLNQKLFRCHVPNKLFKKELFDSDQIRFPVSRLYEDVFTTYRLFLNAGKVSYISSYLYNYLQKRTGSILNSGFSDSQLDILEALDEIWDYIKTVEPKFESSMSTLVANSVVSLTNMVIRAYDHINEQRKQELQAMLIYTVKRYGHIHWLKLIISSPLYGIRFFLLTHCFHAYLFMMEIKSKW